MGLLRGVGRKGNYGRVDQGLTGAGQGKRGGISGGDRERRPWERKGTPEETQDRNQLEETPDSGIREKSRWAGDPGVRGVQVVVWWGGWCSSDRGKRGG